MFNISVDIDLTYLPLKDRAESLVEINDTMDRIAAAIEGGISGAKAQRIAGGATHLVTRRRSERSSSSCRRQGTR